MKELDKIQEQLQELLASTKGKFLVMEEEIDIDTQVEYFELSDNVKEPEFYSEEENWSDVLDDNIEEEQRKHILCQIAKIQDVKAYRFLEKVSVETKNKVIKKWSLLALQESRMKLHAELTDEDQIFISTGLGGKDSRLRYIAVFYHKQYELFKDFQSKLLKSEIESVFGKNECEIEELNCNESFILVKVLIPIEQNLNVLFNKIISDANEIGDFVSDDLIITNIKPLNEEEIKAILENKKKDSYEP